MSKFNKDNKGIENGYKIFLGEDLGLTDTINVSHPQFDELYVQQMGQIWNELEVDLTQDTIDMVSADPAVVDLMRKTISWQHLADSVVSRSVVDCLGRFCTDSSLMDILSAWNLFENIHGRTYSHIIKQTFTDPVKGLKEIYDNKFILDRSTKIINVLDEISSFREDPQNKNEEFELKKLIYKTTVAFFIMEGISFMSSFAVTFAIAETDIFQGIAQNVKLVCRDEILHCRTAYEMVKVLQSDPDWALVVESCKGDIKEMLDEAMQDEYTWSQYLFSEGRSVLGLSEDLLNKYVNYSATSVYKALGIPFDNSVEVDPLPYMENYIDSTNVQSAAQEINLVNYNVGAIYDDTARLDLTEFESYYRP